MGTGGDASITMDLGSLQVGIVAAAKRTDGQLVEDGWLALRTTIMEKVPNLKEEEARDVFYFGALHLWSTIAIMIGQNEDGKAKDRKLAMIHAELVSFADDMVSGDRQSQTPRRRH